MSNFSGPSSDFFIKFTLSLFLVGLSDSQEVFLVSDLSVDLVKLSGVSSDSLVSGGDGVSIYDKSGLVGGNLSGVNGVEVSKRVTEVGEDILEELENSSGLISISKVLGKGNKNLDNMSVHVHTLEFLGDLLQVSLGLLDLNEGSFSRDESFNESDTFFDGILSIFVLLDILFISSLVLSSSLDGSSSSGFSLSNKFFVICNKSFESFLLWVEIVKMEFGSTDSSIGISKSISNFGFEGVVFLGVVSVLGLFEVDLEVDVNDKVSEGDFELINWSFGL